MRNIRVMLLSLMRNLRVMLLSLMRNLQLLLLSLMRNLQPRNLSMYIEVLQRQMLYLHSFHCLMRSLQTRNRKHKLCK